MATITANAKLTDTQKRALEWPIRQYDDAQVDFETWVITSDWCNVTRQKYESVDDYVEGEIMFFAKRDRPNDVEGYIADRIARLRETWENHRVGVVSARMSSNTLRALERKGYVEIIEDGRSMWDEIRLLCV